MDPFMVQLTQSIHDERVENLMQQRSHNLVSNTSKNVLQWLNELVAANAQKLNFKSLTLRTGSAFRIR